MLQYQTPKAVDARELTKYVTISGRLIVLNNEDYMKLVRLAHDFKRTINVAVKMIARGVDEKTILKELRRRLNKAYGDSAYKTAKMIYRGCLTNNGDPLKIRVKKLFIVSEGEATRYGNRNIRLESTSIVKIKYPYDGSWLIFGVCFGREYLSLINEVVALAKQKRVSYNAKIVFKSSKVYLHLSVSLDLYLKYFGKHVSHGRYITGFDLNSDRINMVVVDESGIIRDARTEWFPEVTSHGYPRNKAKAKRLEALAKLLDYAYHHNVGVVVFENLFQIKKRRFTRDPTANRKIMRFPKRKLLQHAIIMALKYGFKVYLVNPARTSKYAMKIHRKLGLDIHTASAYIIALRGLNHKIT